MNPDIGDMFHQQPNNLPDDRAALAVQDMLEQANNPGCAEVAKCNFYVDDLLLSMDDVGATIQNVSELCALQRMGSFKFKKWASNF